MSPHKTKKGVVTGSFNESSPGDVTAGPSGKRCRLSSDDDEDEFISPKKGKASSYHQGSTPGISGLRSPVFSSHNKPAELFRKDLISAMRLADSEPLQSEEYLLIADPWRQEWERGVQVPVNSADFNIPVISEVKDKDILNDFKMPRKFLHSTQDGTYRQGIHELTGMQQLSEMVVRYDLDDVDVCWLERANEEREEMGQTLIHEWIMEGVIEALEMECHEKIEHIKKTKDGLGIEYDANVACDVCRSKEGEDTNEMVFCDGCNMCVHQACYGIQVIPTGDWLCRTCALGINPSCVLCPNKGGAMKSTRSGTKWAHVSCALWIPEVSIGVPEKMEPITKISNIPPSRWALICCLCGERQGACIQCSVKSCKIAFHVTCGFQNCLTMKTVLEEDAVDGVKLRAYCPKHSRRHGEEQDSLYMDTKDMTSEDLENFRHYKLQELKETFYSVIDVPALAQRLQVDEDIIDDVSVYWRLKRKSNFDQPLLMPKTDEADRLKRQQSDSLVARLKMFVHLRQDLERVRNLCYMVSKREKMKRQYQRSHESVFKMLNDVLTHKNLALSARESERLAKDFNVFIAPPQDFSSSKSGMDMNMNNNQFNDAASDISDHLQHLHSHLFENSDTRTSFLSESADERTSPPRLSPEISGRHDALSSEDDFSELESVRRQSKFTEQSDDKSPLSLDVPEKSFSPKPQSGHKLSPKRSRRSKFRKGHASRVSKHLNKSKDTKNVDKIENVKQNAVDSKRTMIDSKLVNEVAHENVMLQNANKGCEKVRKLTSKLGNKRHSSRRMLRHRRHRKKKVQPNYSMPPSEPSVENRAEQKVELRVPHKVEQKCEVEVESKESFVPLPPVKSDIPPAVRAKLDALFDKSKLLFSNEMKNKAQRHWLKYDGKSRCLNGYHMSQRSLDRCAKLAGDSVMHKSGNGLSTSLTRSSARVLNEIPPDKGKKTFEENVFATHFSSRGSLSGYKIPKKSNNSASACNNSLTSVLPQEEVSVVNRGSMVTQFDWCRSLPETRSNRRKLDGSMDMGVKKNIFGEFGGSSPRFDPPDFRSLQKGTVEVIPTLGVYRTQSPFSDGLEELDIERSDCSRESTPRRVTRSQLFDLDENTVGQSPHVAGHPPRLKDNWLKPPQFS